MKKIERIKMVKAMEFIIRNLNNEDLMELWLMSGVADGDIEYGDLSDSDLEGEMDYYIDDGTFADLMDIFLVTMAEAKKDDGLYCDRIVSKEAD